ncbi:MAG TPA: hypothetical protein VMU86_07970 [Steroidobacteraceae bacterium]|nr:hypothetical protein [Steroidobacteraceae bacterium]
MRARHVVAACAVAALFVGGSAQAFGWAGLWSTPDQRAERLLRQGRAQAAARLFRDPRRRAFAEIEARNYGAAAAQLQPFTDPLSQYDRGNALALAGRLAEAIDAYSAALRQTPPGSGLHRDALHNRALVERQLKSQPQHPPQPPQAAKDQSGKQGAAGKPGASGQNGASQKGGLQPQGAQSKAQGRSSPAAPRNGAGRGKAASRQNAGAAQNPAVAQKVAGRSSSGASPRPAANGQASHAAEPASAAARARRDAGLALGRTPRNPGGERSPPPRESERNLSLDEWLRFIPDNPGGLLRRKFMIEHLLQQERAGTGR